jgi:hypothetical protein
MRRCRLRIAESPSIRSGVRGEYEAAAFYGFFVDRPSLIRYSV